VARKRRLRRKDLKQPDEFLTLSSQAMIWVRAHPQTVTWTGIGLLVLFVAVLVTFSYRSSRRHDSNADLGRAMAVLRTGGLADAATQLTAVAQRWPSTPAGRAAAILAANAEIRQDNTETAIVLIEKLLDSSHDFPDYLHQELLFDWAQALEDQKQWNDAAEKYKSAAALTGPFAGPAVLGEARVSDLNGDSARAKELYQQYVEKFPDFPDQGVARERIGS